MDRSELPAFDFPRRVEAVREALDGRTMLLSHRTNIRWLTGFGGSLGWVVIGPDRLALVTDGRYRDRAAADLDAAGLDADLVVRTVRAELAEALVSTASGPASILAEAQHVSHAAWEDLADELPIEPAGGIIEQLRRVKDAGEVARMALAAEIADRTLVEVAPDARPRADRGRRARRARVPDAPQRRRRAELRHDRRQRPENAARPHHATGRRTIVGRRHRHHRRRRARRRLPLRHDPHVRGRRARRPPDRDLRHRPRGAGRRPRRRARRRRRGRRRRGLSRRSSATPDWKIGTSTAPGTASVSTSTRTRSRAPRRRPSSSSATW